MKRFSVLLIGLVTVAAGLWVPMPAFAHGEKAQMAFLRMRSIHWYDIQVSPTQVSINEEVVVTGKFRPSEFWPSSLPKPEVAYINVGVPGPVFVRLESEVNGANMVNSTSFELGATYDFRMVIKARKAGRFHVHPVIHVQHAGPLVGPGIWVETTGNDADFRHDVTTLTGKTVNLETFGFGAVVSWHIVWFVLGLVWLVYWLFFKGRLLLPRYRRVGELGDNADSMITRTDRNLAFGMLGTTLVLVAFGYYWADAKYPNTVPLQTGRIAVAPSPVPAQVVAVQLDRATYRIPGRSLTLNARITNLSDGPLQIGELATANVRFINDKAVKIEPIDSHDLVAPSGLTVSGGAIAPGETRDIAIKAADSLWETHRLSRLIYDPDSRFAALLFFIDSDGERHAVEVSGPIIPTFES